MKLPSYFSDFLNNIRLTSNQVTDLKVGHQTLRRRLEEDESLAPFLVSTFLQGSYRRSTAVRPKGGERADADVIVVTTLDPEKVTPHEAVEIFVPFLDRHYARRYRIQGRSIGIELSYVDLDVVITSAPSEVSRDILRSESVTTDEELAHLPDWRLVKSWVAPEHRSARSAALLELAKREAEWKADPLRIPDRDVKRWERTHPLKQIQWTWEKNSITSGRYVNVVKAIKWWRRITANGECPKGYPVEHLVGVSCPSGIESIAEGVTLSLESIAQTYASYAQLKQTPFLPDHGVPEHNVFKRVSGEEFATFHAKVSDAAAIAREALDNPDVAESADAWRRLFGDKFPAPPESDTEKSGGFTPRKAATMISGGRYA